jgi:hypothetical protein
LSLGDSACVADTSAKKGNNIVKKVSVIKARDKQAVNVVINCKDGKEVINNNKKVFNTFNNNKDKDYKKSNKDKNTINNKKGLSKVNISKSDDKDCIKAGNNSKKVSVIKGDKNINKRESR